MGLLMLGRQKTHTAEPLMPELSAFEVAMATEKLKRCKLPGNNQIPAELIKAGERTTCSEIHKLSNSIWNKEVLPEEWKESIIVLIYHKGNKTEAYNFRQIHTYLLHGAESFLRS